MTNSLLLGNFEQNLFCLLFSSINFTSQGARLSFEKTTMPSVRLHSNQIFGVCVIKQGLHQNLENVNSID